MNADVRLTKCRRLGPATDNVMTVPWWCDNDSVINTGDIYHCQIASGCSPLLRYRDLEMFRSRLLEKWSYLVTLLQQTDLGLSVSEIYRYLPLNSKMKYTTTLLKYHAGRLTRERQECDFHRTSNYLGIRIIHVRIKQEVPVLMLCLEVSNCSLWISSLPFQ